MEYVAVVSTATFAMFPIFIVWKFFNFLKFIMYWHSVIVQVLYGITAPCTLIWFIIFITIIFIVRIFIVIFYIKFYEYELIDCYAWNKKTMLNKGRIFWNQLLPSFACAATFPIEMIVCNIEYRNSTIQMDGINSRAILIPLQPPTNESYKT